MRGRNRALLNFLMYLVVVLILAGCSPKSEPLTFSPESSIKIDYMEDIVNNEEKYEVAYKHYLYKSVVGVISEEFDTFTKELEEEHGKERLEQFMENGEKHLALQAALFDNQESNLDEEVKVFIDDYLKYTRLGDEGADDFAFSKAMEDQNPIGKVKQYMEENNILIEEIILPETVEDTNYNIYPLKHTYRYTIKGTANNEPFEEEIVQDFYIGFDWSEEEEKVWFVIEYICDADEV